MLSLFDGPHEVTVDEALDHPGGDRPAQGLDPRLVVRLARYLARRFDPTSWSPTAATPSSTSCRPRSLSAPPIVYYATGTFSRGSGKAKVALWRLLVAAGGRRGGRGRRGARGVCTAPRRAPDSVWCWLPTGVTQRSSTRATVHRGDRAGDGVRGRPHDGQTAADVSSTWSGRCAGPGYVAARRDVRRRACRR